MAEHRSGHETSLRQVPLEGAKHAVSWGGLRADLDGEVVLLDGCSELVDARGHRAGETDLQGGRRVKLLQRPAFFAEAFSQGGMELWRAFCEKGYDVEKGVAG